MLPERRAPRPAIDAGVCECDGGAKDLAEVSAFGMREELETFDDLSDGFLHSFAAKVAKKVRVILA